MSESSSNPRRSLVIRLIIVIAAPLVMAHIENLQTRGESLRIADKEPDPIPDPGENFAEADFIRDLVSKAREEALTGTEKLRSKYSPNAIPGYKPPDTSKSVRFMTVSPIHMSFSELETDEEAATVIRSFMKSLEEDLKEIENATLRPHSNLLIEYSEGYSLGLPEGTVFHDIAKLLHLRARASIHFGESEQALDDIHTLLLLTKHLSAETSLIFQLIGNLFYGQAIGEIREGIQKQTWNSAQLEALNVALNFQPLSRGFMSSLRMERAIFAETMVQLAQGEYPQIQEVENLIPDVEIPITLIPKGVLYENALAHSEILQICLFDSEEGGDRVNQVPFDIDIDKEINARMSSRVDRIRYVFSFISLPVYEGIPVRFQRVQVLNDHAKPAILLEIHAQEQGSYPSTLQDLRPGREVLNATDPFTGLPYVYEQLGRSDFKLYSVGPNRIDEKGLIKHDYDDGDWVWRPDLPEDFDYKAYRER